MTVAIEQQFIIKRLQMKMELNTLNGLLLLQNLKLDIVLFQLAEF